MATSYPFDVTRHTTNSVWRPVRPGRHAESDASISSTSTAPRPFGCAENVHHRSQRKPANNTYGHILDQYVGTTANARYPVGATDVAETVSIPADPRRVMMTKDSS